MGIRRPTITFSESVFAAHKSRVHGENRDDVLKDIHESNSGKNRALTCDRCFRVVLLRPETLGILEDPSRTVEPITTVSENIRFLFLHELLHVKLEDSELKEKGAYHTRNMLLLFNQYARELGVTRYRE